MIWRTCSVLLLAGCATTPRPLPVRDYCDLATAILEQVVRPSAVEPDGLEDGCVADMAGKNGRIYVDVNANDLPLTASYECKPGKWMITIGRRNHQPSSQGVVLINLFEAVGGANKFGASVEKADWRDHPSRYALSGCGIGTSWGTVRRTSKGWTAQIEAPPHVEGAL